MAKSTNAEEQLLMHITEHRLRASLIAVRQAMEYIWADDAPRIVQDYTDHGENHSKRLAGFAVKLLEANVGRNLSVQEMYLLIAGIYLHDIGMQCDVVKFPEIKARAESLGAEFEIAFTARTASSYSIDEQRAIRRNHHYLAAAWIDHANRTCTTALGSAAQTIPEELVDDLMDVCKYHAKLPITDCPRELKFDPTHCKQLVAALLRFSDELDVDGHRVSIETVRNFSVDSHNSVYWWLHNRTKIVFIAPHVILLTIRLHPYDKKQMGSFVHGAFISKFRSKNQQVLSVLALNGIPIVCDNNSRVVEHDRTERLPSEIVLILQAMYEKLDASDAVERTYRPAAKIPHTLSSPEVTVDQTVSKRILVIEDRENWRDTLGRLLDGRGFEVEYETGYRTGLDKILESGSRSSVVDLALCIVDLSLDSGGDEENWDGLGLLALCRITKIPTIVVSGRLTQELKDQLRDQYGVMASFDKGALPVDELLASVEQALILPRR